MSPRVNQAGASRWDQPTSFTAGECSCWCVRFRLSPLSWLWPPCQRAHVFIWRSVIIHITVTWASDSVMDAVIDRIETVITRTLIIKVWLWILLYHSQILMYQRTTYNACLQINVYVILQNGKHDEAWMILKQVHDTNMRAKGHPERVFSVSTAVFPHAIQLQ